MTERSSPPDPAIRSAARLHLERLYPGCRIESLAGDASTRRFYRLRPDDDTSAIVMDYGQALADEPDDVPLERIFRDAGLPVARILERWLDVGCLLLEDLGDRSLESAVLEGSPDRKEAIELLDRAVKLAGEIAARGTRMLAGSARARGPALDRARFVFEMDFFVENYLQGLLGLREIPAGLISALHGLARASAVEPGEGVLCHRDFHSRNLMLRDDGKLYMVDIQDARWGPDSYDLASILRDAYLPSDEQRLDDRIELFRRCLPDPPDARTFRDRFDRVAAQRMLKALGTFGHQITVRKRELYRPAISSTLLRLPMTLQASAEGERLHALLNATGALDAPQD